MELFFSNNIKDNHIILNNIESKHCIKVLRKSSGDIVNVVDGKGTLYKGIIESDSSKECHIQIQDIYKNYNKRDYYIHIAISPIKNNNRIEWFVEKAIEFGVDEISFIACNRTLRKAIKIDRIIKTAISAMKQTLKANLPKINDVCSLDNFIKNNKETNKFICHLEDDSRYDLFKYKSEIKNDKNTCILIGPEGDFTSNEIIFAEKNKFISIDLGKSRLRTETAGIASCHLLNIINNL